MEKFLYDLHTHSQNSDGQYSINELLKMAESAGLKGLGITDHDSLGSKTDENTINEFGSVKGVLGVEFATDISNLHLVGYMRTWNNSPLKKFLSTQKEARERAAMNTLKKANEMGFSMNYETLIKKYTKGAAIGRPHIAHYLVDLNIVSGIREAFDKYLKIGMPLYIEKKRIGFEELIKKAKSEFNIIIGLAHPFYMDRKSDEIYKIIDRAIEFNIDGIEVHYAGHTKDQVHYLNQLCEARGLLKLGGSDFHGEKIKSDVTLGSGGLFEEDFFKLLDKIDSL